MIKSVRADNERLTVSSGYMGVNNNQNLGQRIITAYERPYNLKLCRSALQEEVIS